MRYYVYYTPETKNNFVTVYAWSHDHTARMYCQHIGAGRYTHSDIQLDIQELTLTHKESNTRYQLIEPRRQRNNLQFETREVELVEWQL